MGAKRPLRLVYLNIEKYYIENTGEYCSYTSTLIYLNTEKYDIERTLENTVHTLPLSFI